MKIVKANGVPIYEVTCIECKSVIRYKACEVLWYHITCPVCGVSLWANMISPVDYESRENRLDAQTEGRQQPKEKAYEIK